MAEGLTETDYPHLRRRLAAQVAEYEAARVDLKFRVEAALPGIVELLGSRYQASEIWLFGSFALGAWRPDSDLNLAVALPAESYADLLQAEIQVRRRFALPVHLTLMLGAPGTEERLVFEERGVRLVGNWPPATGCGRGARWSAKVSQPNRRGYRALAEGE